MKLVVRHFIDASHQLPDTETLVTKGCARLHGHTYCFEVTAAGALRDGMVVDFKAIKNIIDRLDHQHINEVFKADGYEEPPTAENIAKWVYKKIGDELGIFVVEVRCCEGYKGEERASWAVYGGGQA